MSKLKALTLSMLFAVQSVLFYLTHNTPFMVIAILGTLLFLSIWTTKYQRDHKIANQARLERAKTAQTAESLPPMMHENSRGLFVPPPMDQK